MKKEKRQLSSPFNGNSKKKKTKDYSTPDPLTFHLEYDSYYRIQIPNEYTRSIRSRFEREHRENDGDVMAILIPRLTEILRRGWADRVVRFDIYPQPQPHSNDQKALVIGVREATGSGIPLTRGPSADAERAKDFRKFWGDRSELRKFADNAICEAILWSMDDTREHGSVLLQIIRHVLKIHLDIDPLWIDQRQLSILPSPMNKSMTNGYQILIEAFDRLSRSLRLLRDLPLAITHIYPISEYLRQSETFDWSIDEIDSNTRDNGDGHMACPKMNRICPIYVPSVLVAIGLEQSGKWPDEAMAIERLKTAFYLQMADSLDRDYRCWVMDDCLFISVGRIKFRITIVNAREVHSAKKRESVVLKESMALKEGLLKESMESRRLEIEHVHRPKLSSSLHSVSQQYHGLWGEACCMAKRWIGYQLLSDLLPDVAVELLMAAVFIHPQSPFETPSSAFSAFLRFLHLLSTTDWLLSPVMVNLGSVWTDGDMERVENQFIRLRPSLPPLCICCPEDETGARQNPSAMVLDRVCGLARNLLAFLRSHILSNVEMDINRLIRPSIEHYDCLIRLHGRQIARSRTIDMGSISKTIDMDTVSSVDETKDKELSVIDFDPVQLFVRQLKAAHGHLAVFFHDRYGGDVIGVLWRPSALDSRPLKMTSCAGQRPVMDGEMVADVEAVMEDFRIIGRNLVRDVILVDKKKN